MPRHEPWPEHVIAHDSAALQLMPLTHALLVVHKIAQFHPAGHTIAALPVQLVVAQSIVHVFAASLQLVHCGGHVDASIMIGPSVLGPSVPFGASTIPPGTMQ